jgi:RES domain-containing protein
LVAYRIGSSAYPLLDGAGAAASDAARWNSRGRYIIYAAEHYATALLEKAAQLSSLKMPRTLVYTRIDVPAATSSEELEPDDLPGWDSTNKSESQHFGDLWYDQKRTLLLLVPSLVASGLERNLLINQRHPEFVRVTASLPEPLRCHPNLFT